MHLIFHTDFFRTIKPFVLGATILMTLPPQSAAAGGVGDTMNIPYAQTSPDQFLNIYYPSGAGPFSFVVFVHGGGWTKGSANLGHTVAAGLAPKGYAVVSVEYRKPPTVSPSDTVQDVADASAFILKNAARFNLQPNHFALLAHSAGSQMVALVATDPSYAAHAGLDLNRLAVVGVLDGIFDLTTAIQSDDKAQKRDHQLTLFGNDPNYWRAMSPINHMDTVSSSEYFCVLHEDTVSVFQSQAQRLVAALQAHHVPFAEATMSGYSHGQMVQDFKETYSPVAAAFLDCLSHGGM